MTNTQQLLDNARQLCQPPTWYRLAKNTGIHNAQISRCISQGKTLDNKSVWKLSKFLGQNFEQVLSLVELDRSTRPADRAFWERIAPRILPSFVAALLAAAVFTPGRAKSATEEAGQTRQVWQDAGNCQLTGPSLCELAWRWIQALFKPFAALAR